MTQILNNDILESGDLIIQIAQVTHIDFKWITDVSHYINAQVNGIKDVIIANNVISLKNTVITLVFAVLICLSDGSFIGPGGKNILNDEPSWAPGVKNTLETKLETKLEQNPILEQKEKEKERPKSNIVLKIAKSGNMSGVRTDTATLLYEKLDRDSSTIVALSRLLTNSRITDFRGGSPNRYRTGIHLDTVTPAGTIIAPESTSWTVNGVLYNGVVCPALRHPDPDVKFVDSMGRDIVYNGNSMLIPFSIAGRPPVNRV